MERRGFMKSLAGLFGGAVAAKAKDERPVIQPHPQPVNTYGVCSGWSVPCMSAAPIIIASGTMTIPFKHHS